MSSPLRSRLLPLAIALLLTACQAADEPGTRPERRNVLVVVLDTVRADRLSVYGYERPTTPTLSRVAAEGVRFERAVSAAPWTIPSHASMLTGLDPGQHGAHHEHWRLDPEIPTLAERFAAAGYRTAAFSANPFVGPPSGLQRGFARFENVYEGGAEVSARALAFAAEGGAPWLMLLNYMEAHLPYALVPREKARRFLPDARDADLLVGLEQQARAFAYSCGEARPTEAETERLGAVYDAAIAHLDGLVGTLLDGLGPALDDTVVAIVSDHGELLGEHGLVEHQFALYEPLLRVPLLLRAPGRIAPGTTVGETVSTAELHGLLLELSGAFPETGPPERALARLGERRRPVVSEYYRPQSLLPKVAERFPGCPPRLDQRLTSVREGQHKLVLRSDGSVRLHDLERDPGEEHDARAALPALARRLEARAREIQASGRNRGGETPALDPDTRRRLEALGYGGG